MKQHTSRGYTPPISVEEKLLQRRVADIVKAASNSGVDRFLGFLNEREQQLATAQLNRVQCANYTYNGGFEGAERRMLCVFEDIDEVVFPITQVALQVVGAGTLTHRDYLGALLGTGIKRECIGDIVTDDAGAVIFMQASILPFLMENLMQVGRFTVALQIVVPTAAPKAAVQTGDSRTANVASLRLDAVLAAILHSSRGRAVALIAQGAVAVNHLPVQTAHYAVCDGDIFSVRGTGKFRLCSVGGKSRKNRIFVEYIQY